MRDFIFCGDFARRLTIRRMKNRGRGQTRRQSWPHHDRTVRLSQVVHITLRCMLEPDASSTGSRLFDVHGGHGACCALEWSATMKEKDRICEREYQSRLESLLKTTFNTQLQPLRLLETATKKRRAQKKAASNSGFTKSTTTTSR